MGIRADFYVGRGKDAEWLGSIALDGYPSGIEPSVLHCTDEQAYRDFVTLFLQSQNSATFPNDGWPWPWNDSKTTDYSYAFDAGVVYACCFGYFWFKATEPEPIQEEHPELWDVQSVDFPNMESVKNVTFGKRSGLIILG